jgi:hypothetical protein
MLFYVVGFRFISLKLARLHKGEISYFRVDDRTLLAYIFYSECFAIVGDLELGFFRLGIFLFSIMTYFLIRLAFRSLFD